MKDIDQAIALIRGELPPNTFIRKIETSQGTPERGFKKHFMGFEAMLHENQCNRREAIGTFNAIRIKLPNLRETSFVETLELEWEYELRFMFIDGE
jgi:hypothetical protein